MWMNA